MNYSLQVEGFLPYIATLADYIKLFRSLVLVRNYVDQIILMKLLILIDL